MQFIQEYRGASKGGSSVKLTSFYHGILGHSIGMVQ